MPNQPTKNEISSVDSQSLSEKTPGSSEARNQAPVPSARLTIVLDRSTPARACVARSWSEYGPSSAPIRWTTKALGMVMAHPLRDVCRVPAESPEDTGQRSATRAFGRIRWAGDLDRRWYPD